jgi:hypothetical protein
LVMGESMTLVIIGVGLGLTAAVAASRLVASLLFGLAATDVVTTLAATMVLVAVSAVAGYLPARPGCSGHRCGILRDGASEPDRLFPGTCRSGHSRTQDGRAIARPHSRRRRLVRRSSGSRP